jgi:putative ATPase
VRRIIEEGRSRLELRDRRTVLFVDEIHRFNKGQQDALLPGVEAGWVTLIGATTENPFFELNAPLLSRCQLVRLEPLTDDDVRTLLDRACATPSAASAAGSRSTTRRRRPPRPRRRRRRPAALTALEVAASRPGSPPGGPGSDGDGTDAPPTRGGDLDPRRRRRRDAALPLRQGRRRHYDQVSAFIKSMRGSDPDAAAYWLLRMLESGEDPRFLARRMVIFASEDVGLADRQALPLAVAAFDALDKVGLPEAATR